MRHTMQSLTDAIVGRYVSSLPFEENYRNVYDAVSQHRGGDAWFAELEVLVHRLAVAFHCDRERYDHATVVVSDVCMFPNVTYCKVVSKESVSDVFDRAWKRWHSDRAFRARALWARVRAVRVKLVAVARWLAILEEVQLRPGGTLAQRLEKHFNKSILIQQQQH